MNSAASLAQAVTPETSTHVHGPRLAGVWQKVGIGAWAVLFLLCLFAAVMSIAYIDLWFRTPYTAITQLAPEYEPAAIEETLKPFQEAIFELGLTLDLYAHYFTALRVLSGLPYFLLSFLIILRRSDRLMAVLFAVTLALLGAAGTVFNPLWEWLSESYAWKAPLVTLLNILLFGCILIFYSFPDGRFVPRWTRWLALLIVPYAAVAYLLPDSLLNPDNWAAPVAPFLRVLFLGTGVYAIVYRYRTYADNIQKQQLKWFTAGLILLALSYFLDLAVWGIYPALTDDTLIQAGRTAVLWELFQDTSWYLAEFAFAACIAVSILRYRLWDIDLIINRALVYGSLTALTMLVYLAAVSALGSLFRGLAGQWAFFLATGLVAILFEPLRRRLQRVVNRLMYGERDDPYAVLTRLSAALEMTPVPDEALPAVAAQIGAALKLPYVALSLEQNGEERLVAEFGNQVTGLLSCPLVYQGETIGHLQLARRASGEEFTTQERSLIENIARQASAAAQAARLHTELVRSRAEIVVAREEERRRLRRDLHDGLGPILASQMLKLAGVRQLIRKRPEKAEALIDEVIQQNENTVAEVRHLVYGLRPPALDELGLVQALRELEITVEGARHGRRGLEIEIQAPAEALPDLPAAVEVNAYRIVLEAVTNAARHARAWRCQVSFSTETGADQRQVLVIQIEDDGMGLPHAYRPGVGLRSMRERAEELGGRLQITSRQGGGTSITAWLPLVT